MHAQIICGDSYIELKRTLLQYSQQMSAYQRIVAQFQKQGLFEDQQVSEYEVRKALDNITYANVGSHEFDAEVAREIWKETADKAMGAPVYLRDFATTMVQAENILREQVEQTQSQIRRESNEARKQELLNDLFSYSQDHRGITTPFGLEQIRESKQILESKSMVYSGVAPNESKLFAQEVDEREESTDLKIVLLITLALLAVELVTLFHKHHFMTLLCLFMIISAFVLNYFEKKYVVLMMASLGISTIFDLAWLIAQAGQYWNPASESQHSGLQRGFLRFIVFMVCTGMLAKGVLIGLLFKYRAVGEHVKKKVNLAGMTFILDGQVDAHNLILRALANPTDESKPFEGL